MNSWLLRKMSHFPDLTCTNSLFFLKVFRVCQHLRCTHLQGSINPAISILISVVISHCKDIKRTKTLKSFESQLNQIVETVINFWILFLNRMKWMSCCQQVAFVTSLPLFSFSSMPTHCGSPLWSQYCA